MPQKSIKWDITTKCNLHCAHCSVGKEYFVEKIREIPLSAKLQVVDKLAEGGVGGISLLGGEPLTLGNDLISVVKHANSKGIKMSLVTNGLLLEGQFMENLVSAGLDRIVISIEGATAESHEFIRGKGNFKKLLNNLSNLKEYITKTNSSLSIGTNTVLNQKNYPEIEKMMDLLEQIGVDEWTLLSLGGVGYAEDNIDSLSITSLMEVDMARRVAQKVNRERPEFSINPLFTYPLVWDYIEKKYGFKMVKPRICCTASMSLGFVSPDGNLYPCDRISKEYFVGNKLDGSPIEHMSLLEHSFYEIWNSEYFLKMFNFILDASTYRQYSPCNSCLYFKKRFCNPCPLYSLTSKVVIGSCAIVAKEMSQEMESLDRNYPVEELFGFEKASQELEAKLDSNSLNQLISCTPKKRAGIRSFGTEDSLLLLNPKNVEYISLNLVGKAAWELIDGKKTVKQICEEINESVDLALKKNSPDQAINPKVHDQINKRVLSFFEELVKLDLIATQA